MNMKKSANVILSIFLGLAAAIGLVVCSSALSHKGLFMGGQKVSASVSALADKVVLKQYELGQDPNSWVKADFIIENGSDSDVKNLKIRCEFNDAENRYCDTELWLLHGIVPAGKQMLHQSLNRKFISSRAANLQCKLVDLTVIAPVEPSHGAHEYHGEATHEAEHETEASHEVEHSEAPGEKQPDADH